MSTLAMPALAFACALALTAAQAARASISVVDDGGEQVTLAAPAQRVVALAPHAVELAYAAGGGGKLVGAVSYSDYPEAAKALPRVGTNTTLDLERIVALKPDLVIVWRHGNSQRQLDRLRALEYSYPKFGAESLFHAGPFPKSGARPDGISRVPAEGLPRLAAHEGLSCRPALN